MTNLNKRLLVRQHISPVVEKYILTLHAMKDVLLKFEKGLDPSCSSKVFRQLPKVMEDIEYSMQKAWKFEQGKDYHTHWNRFFNCNCPVLDNDDLIGLPQRIINMSCPLHGKEGVDV